MSKLKTSLCIAALSLAIGVGGWQYFRAESVSSASSENTPTVESEKNQVASNDDAKVILQTEGLKEQEIAIPSINTNEKSALITAQNNNTVIKHEYDGIATKNDKTRKVKLQELEAIKQDATPLGNTGALETIKEQNTPLGDTTVAEITGPIVPNLTQAQGNMVKNLTINNGVVTATLPTSNVTQTVSSSGNGSSNGTNGSSDVGSNNGNNGSNGSNGSNGGSNTPKPEVKPPVVPEVKPPATPEVELPSATNAIDVSASKIVNVSGVSYAVVTFTSDAKEWQSYTYQVSGSPTALVSPVNTSGNVVKIQLPDSTERTVSITEKDASKTVIKVGIDNSQIVTAETVDSELIIKDVAPYLVLTKENISLEQYLKQIVLGENVFIKSKSDTVGTPVITRASVVDAVSSATVNVPTDFEGETIDATIAVNFNMFANNTIAKELNIKDKNTDALFDKWEKLDKTIALNKDFTKYIDYAQIGSELTNEVAEGTLPKYVKYLVSTGLYGTKVNFSEDKPDSLIAPTISIASVIKGNDTVMRLSEENETWYRYITEISVPYTDTKTHFYHGTKSISDDELTVTLPVDAISGPMNYVSDYMVTIESFGFEDVTIPLHVVDSPPTFTPTWDNANTQLKLKADFSYYCDYAAEIMLNGQTLIKGKDFTTDTNNIYISYKYLQTGENKMTIVAPKYADNAVNLTAPENFIKPKSSPNLSVMTYLSVANAPVVLSAEQFEADSEQEEWWNALSSSHATITGGYSTITVGNITKDLENKTISIAQNGTLNTYNSYTLAIIVPGFDKVTLKVNPVKAPPALTTAWNSAYSLLITENNGAFSSYISGYVNEIKIDGKTLVKNLDYKLDSYGIEIYANNFTKGNTHEIELIDTSSSGGYAKTILTATTPTEFETPKASPTVVAKTIAMGKELILDVPTDYTQWSNSITKITVKTGTSTTETEIAKTLYTVDDEKITLPASAFAYNDVYTITITSKGYVNTYVTATVVKSATVNKAWDYNNGRLTLTAFNGTSADNYFYNNVVVTLNGNALTSSVDYTTSSYSNIMNVLASKFTEDSNTLELSSPGYEKVTLIVGKYTTPEEAPTIAVANTVSDVTSFTFSVDNEAWLEKLTQADVSLKTYSNVAISGIAKDAETKTVTVTLSGKLSTSEHTLSVSVDGYKTATTKFTPLTAPPTLNTKWLDDGRLEISVIDSPYSNYLVSSYRQIKVGDKVLTLNSGYSLTSYTLIINKDNFKVGEATVIEIIDTSTSYKIATSKLEVTYEAPVAPPADLPTVLVSNVIKNQSITAAIIGADLSWADSITSIVITKSGISVPEITSGWKIANGVVTIPYDAKMTATGTYGIAIKSTGYSDLSKTFDVISGYEVGFSDFDQEPIWYATYLYIRFDNSYAKDSLTSLTVNGVKVTDYTFPTTTKINIPNANFTSGRNVIVATFNGYSDFVTAVSYGGTPKAFQLNLEPLVQTIEPEQETPIDLEQETPVAPEQEEPIAPEEETPVDLEQEEPVAPEQETPIDLENEV